MCNPFHYNRPVEPQDFVGRWPLVHQVADDLARVNGESYAIVGGRRFGKSSLLLALKHTLLERLAEAAPGETHLLPLLLDFKALELDTHYHLFAQVAEELRWIMHPACSPRRDPHLPLDLPNLLDALHPDALYPPGGPPTSLSTFKRILGQVIDCAFDVYGPLRLVLLIDEIEEALNRPWTETFFNQLRSLVYSGGLVESLRLVIAGDDRVLKMRAQGSPLLNMLEPEYLSVFNQADTHKLVARAENLPPSVADAVVLQSGGHPYLSQSLMHPIWEEGAARSKLENVEAAVHQLYIERRSILKNWHAAIGPDGRAAYAVLAQANNADWLSEREISARMDDPYLSVTEGVITLCYNGFAQHDGHWRRYRRTGELFRDWFLEEQDTQEQDVLRRLCQRLVTGFNLPELEDLIFELGIAPDEIAGQTRSAKARELASYCKRNGRLGDLEAAIDRLRPQ